RNRTSTPGSGGLCDIHFTTGARKSEAAIIGGELPSTGSRTPPGHWSGRVGNLGAGQASAPIHEHAEELGVDMPVRSGRFRAGEFVFPPGEVAHAPTRLLDDQAAGGGVPGLQLPLPEAVEPATSDV